MTLSPRTITLGLNAAFHDSAAVLVIDGVPVAAAEEERFSRIKHAKRPLPFSAWELPFNSVAWCLQHAGITLADVQHVAYSFDPALFSAGRADLTPEQHGRIGLPLLPGAEADPRRAEWDNPWDALFLAYMANAPQQLEDGAPHHLWQKIHGRAPHQGAGPRQWQWHAVGHHLCHQASAFLAAPFDSCAVMTLDGRGERATTTYGVWRGGRYRPLGEVQVPHSLGLVYEQVTSHLGFLQSSDEYKVMALAAMGRPRWAPWLSERITLHGDGQFTVAPLELAAVAGPPRVPGTPLGPQQLDLAASLQVVLEDTALQLASWLREASGENQLAMAGGVALNCLMNARLRDDGPFARVWVQPAAGDAGTALGAALWVDGVQRLGSSAAADAAVGTAADREAPQGTSLAPRRWVMTNAQLGPGWSDNEIFAALDWAGLPYDVMADEAELAERTAALLAANAMIGWFQGRMEWGPRALGGRSILASPIDPAMQQRLNELKDREDFRPVAPAVTREAFAQWFDRAEANGGTSPFMLFTYPTKPAQAARIPSACHSDASARVQTVSAEEQPRFHALLRAFEARTGVPVLVNTSFNVRGEPVVCSPQHALQAYVSTPLDALVIGRAVLTKRPWP